MYTWLRVCTRTSVVAAAFTLLSATALEAGDIYVAPGDDLQAAIDRAQPGDRLLLAPGATYVGNFVLTNKGASTAFITIRSAAADTLLPPDGVRITPADAFNLPVIKSPNTMSALTTAAGAHHWRLQWLEFQANDRGYGDIISLGSGSTTQTLLSQVPHNLVLDRLYIHGDPVIGQKRGVALHSGATWILNCYISDIKAVGMDTQAIMGYNGPGPWVVVNNYLEAAGENVLIGGASPKIQNLIPSDLEFRNNHMFKPLSWRDPIMGTPTGVTASPGTGGSLAAGTWSYRIVAARRTAQDAWTFSARSAEVTATVGSGGRVSLAWSAVPNATLYRIFRGAAPGAQDRYFESTTPGFVDDGSLGGVANTGESMTGTKWSVKNIFELKVGQRVRVEGNLFEHCWQHAQSGYAVLFTPRNQDATSPWIYVRDVTFTGNVVRHAGAGMQIEGYDSNNTSEQTQRIAVTNNLFDDISGSRWGGPGRLVQLGNAPRDITIDHNTVVHDGHIVFVYSGQVAGFRLTNNLLKHNAYGIMGDGRAYGNDSIGAYLPGAVIERNTLAGGSASRYPAGNEFPTVSAWQAEFVDFAGGNYVLGPSSPYRGTATDGGNLGADIDGLMQAAAIALAGRSDGAPAPAQMSITTASLPDGWKATVYQAQLAASGGSGACDWSVVSGALPGGLSLDPASGSITGTPVSAGSSSFAVRVSDRADATNTATASFTIAVAARPPIVSIQSPVDGATLTGTEVSLVASASDADGAVTRVDFYSGSTLVATSAAAPWAAAWTGVAPGSYVLTAVASDTDGLTTTSAPVAMTMAGESLPPPPPPPPPPSTRPAGEIVLHAADLTRLAGRWRKVADPTAASGARVEIPDAGVLNASPLATPSDFVEAVFSAPAGVRYRLWLRLRATSNVYSNDSVWVQFSDAVTADGQPLFRVGTPTGFNVNLENCTGCGVSGWGWQDDAHWLPPAEIRFAAGGTHALRIHAREDGVMLDQIVLTPIDAGAPAPGPVLDDATVLARTATPPASDIVLYGADIAAGAMKGTWKKEANADSPDGYMVANADRRISQTAAPLASPAHYVDVPFAAPAGTPYRVWLRMRARKNQKSNDSVWMQFSDALAGGSSVFAIGSTSGQVVELQACQSCSADGWGWQDGAYWIAQPPTVSFAYGGIHTLRIQTREDGVDIDQIVISPSTYLTRAPGSATNDSTIIPQP